MLSPARLPLSHNSSSKTVTTNYDGEEYKVSFNFKLFTVSQDGAKGSAKDNKSLANNFVRIEDIQRTSSMALGGNSGVWTTNDIISRDKNSTTVIHEFFHSLGLDHPTPKSKLDFSNPFQIRVKSYHEEPRIVVPRGDNLLVRIPGPVSKPITYRGIDPNERKITQTDIKEAVQNIGKLKALNKIYSSYEN